VKYTRILLLILTSYCFWGMYSYLHNPKSNFFLFQASYGLLIGVYYLSMRLLQKKVIKLFVILGTLFFYITDLNDLLIFSFENQKTLQIIFAFLAQLMFIISFRLEGAMLVQNNFLDNIKTFLPPVLIFICFGILFLDQNDILYYILFLFSALQSMVLITLALFRPVKNYSFYFGTFGVSLLLISNILYLIYYFNYPEFNILFISLSLYFYSQLLIIEGLIYTE
jgi:hypothetical protein